VAELTELNSRERRGGARSHCQIIAVGGGKGGVGKSFVSSSISMFLANMGYSTVVADLDLGGANVHTSLGEPPPALSIQDFLNDPDVSLAQVAVPTRIKNLSLISGHNDALDVANISLDDRSRLMSALFRLPADYMVLDLSAGTHDTTLDFFLMAQKHLVVMAPEPTSIENAYRFMKASFFRKLKRYEHELQISELVADLMGRRGEMGIRSPADLIRQILLRDPIKGRLLKELMNDFEFKLILNQSRTFKDVSLGQSVQSVCRKYFGTNSLFIGHVDYDNAVWQSLRQHRHLLIENPNSRLYAQLLRITRELVNPQLRRAVV
jgi:flagellar biosynthesis protein FlhG